MPITSILSNVTKLAWNVSGDEKVPCCAVATRIRRGKERLHLILGAVATSILRVFMPAKAHAVGDTCHTQLCRANQMLVLAAESWTWQAVTAICGPSLIVSVVMQQGMSMHSANSSTVCTVLVVFVLFERANFAELAAPFCINVRWLLSSVTHTLKHGN